MRKFVIALLLLSSQNLYAQTDFAARAYGFYVKGNYKEAIPLYLQHESALSSGQLYILADCFYLVSPPQYQNALKYFKHSASRDYAEAMTRVAEMYGNGKGVKKDTVEAVKWLLKAVPLKNPYALTKIGEYYYVGKWVPKNKETALNYWKEASRIDDKARYNLGAHYESLGLYKEAANWYKRVHFPEGIFRAARMYDHEFGTLSVQNNPALTFYLHAIDRRLKGDSLNFALNRVAYFSKQKAYLKTPFSNFRGNMEIRMNTLFNYWDHNTKRDMVPKPPLRGGTTEGESGYRSDASGFDHEFFFPESSGPFLEPYFLESRDITTGERFRLIGGCIAFGLTAQEGKLVFDNWVAAIEKGFPDYSLVKTTNSLKGKGKYGGKDVYLDLNLLQRSGLYFIEVLVKDSDKIRVN